nr:MAG TPA: hypothetical protein [Caudoviricetes sp.]
MQAYHHAHSTGCRLLRCKACYFATGEPGIA